MEPMMVHMLGGFSVSYQSKALAFMTRSQSRVIQLFQLLMLYPKGISKEKLVDALYELDEVGDHNRALNNLIYRLRKLLIGAGLPEEEYVQVKNGICMWNEEIPIQIDIEQFVTAMSQAEQAQDDAERTDYLLSAWSVYHGELLPQLSGESWVIVESVWLKRQYEACVRQLGELLKVRRDFQKMYEVFTTAARIYPYEEWEAGQIDSLILMGQPDAALQIYNDALKQYSEELGVAPSDKILDSFQRMRNTLLQEDASIDKIKEKLSEPEFASGAYFCNFFSFLDVYRVLCRLTERSGRSAFLMTCSLNQISGDKEKKNFSKIEEWLKEAICKSLRRSDLCTRYSRSRYLLLLIGMSQEDGQIIMQRIRSNFAANPGTAGYQLEFYLASALDLESMFTNEKKNSF